jgi:hypothetical protein
MILPGSVFYKNADRYEIKFEKAAPHRLLESKTFPKKDIEKAARLTVLIAIFLKVAHLRIKVYNLADETGIKDIAGMLEGFLDNLERDCMTDTAIFEMLDYGVDRSQLMRLSDLPNVGIDRLLARFSEYIGRTAASIQV